MKNPECRGGNDPVLGFLLALIFLANWQDERFANAHYPSNQSMKPTAPLRYDFRVFATTPCRGLSFSR